MKLGNNKGFTLIELMIVVAIIGVLAAIAYPSYIQYKIRTQRVDAQAEMMQIAQRMQSYKMVNHTYAGATVASIYGATTTPQQGTALYSLSFAAAPTVAGWTLIAQPINTTQQKDNGWICLNEQGHKLWAKGVNNCNALSATSNWK